MLWHHSVISFVAVVVFLLTIFGCGDVVNGETDYFPGECDSFHVRDWQINGVEHAPEYWKGRMNYESRFILSAYGRCLYKWKMSICIITCQWHHFANVLSAIDMNMYSAIWWGHCLSDIESSYKHLRTWKFGASPHATQPMCGWTRPRMSAAIGTAQTNTI